MFLQLAGIGALGCGLAGRTIAEEIGKKGRKPNIVLIFADDLGWKDVGYQGSDFMETPNIDGLAKEGVVFTAGYAAAGNCAPSRACMLSGNYTPRHHVYAVNSTDRGRKSQQRLVPVPNKSGLSRENITFADALKSAGYVTGIFGKWHLSGPDGAEPAEQGFDVVYKSFEGWGGREPDDPKGIFSLTQAAGEFMEKNKDRPFLLYLPHYAIHTKLQARASTLEKFKAKTPGKQHNDAMYAACTYDLDDGVGILLKKIKDLGLEEETLVVFTSDNGGTKQSSQEPLRGNKGCYYEGGIREPFIVRWPGVTKPGTKCDVPVINQDLFPTFLDAAGAPVPDGKVLDGESLMPLIKGDGLLKRQAIFWHFPGYLDTPVIRGRELDVRTGFRSRPVSVIHKGDWKLHLYHEEWQLDGGREKIETNHAVELYNLAEDIGERNDLAVSNPAKRDELLDDLLAWLKSTDALIPTKPNPSYDAAAKATGEEKKETKAISGLAAENAEKNSAAVGSCVVTASDPLAFIEKMPRVGSAQGDNFLGARITLTFDNTKGDDSTFSISGAVVDATGLRYEAAWLELETRKPWDGKINKGESKTLKVLTWVTEHKIEVGDSIKIVVVVMDEAGNKAELTSDVVEIIGAG